MQSVRRSSAALIEQLPSSSSAGWPARDEDDRRGPALVPVRGRRIWSVASSALRDAPGFELVRRWVATLNQGALIPWDGGTVSLVPRTAAARAAVAFDFSPGDDARDREQEHDASDPHCDILHGTSAIGRDELAQMQRVANDCPTVYAPNLTAAVILLLRLAATLARVEIVDDRPASRRPSGLDLAHPPKPTRDVANEPGLRLAALRTGDGVSEHNVFVSVPAGRASGRAPLAAHHAFAPKILDAAAFVTSAERGLRGLSRLTAP